MSNQSERDNLWSVQSRFVSAMMLQFQEDPPQKFLSREKNLNSASKVANWIIVHLLKYLYLSISFLLEMVIAKDHLLSLDKKENSIFTYSVSI